MKFSFIKKMNETLKLMKNTMLKLVKSIKILRNNFVHGFHKTSFIRNKTNDYEKLSQSNIRLDIYKKIQKDINSLQQKLKCVDGLNTTQAIFNILDDTNNIKINIDKLINDETKPYASSSSDIIKNFIGWSIIIATCYLVWRSNLRMTYVSR